MCVSVLVIPWFALGGPVYIDRVSHLLFILVRMDK